METVHLFHVSLKVLQVSKHIKSCMSPHHPTGKTSSDALSPANWNTCLFLFLNTEHV